jgi:hypothetical protein
MAHVPIESSERRRKSAAATIAEVASQAGVGASTV